MERMNVFFNDTATTEIYTLSLHDALPISVAGPGPECRPRRDPGPARGLVRRARRTQAAPAGRRGPALGRSVDRRTARTDRKSTRLNSSHANISYAVFCLKKKIITVKDYDL